MSESRELPIEIQKKFIKFLDLKDCKETAIKYSFFEGRVLSYARKANSLWDNISREIEELYPDLRNTKWYLRQKNEKCELLLDKPE